MSRIRIVGGTITKTTIGAHHMYSDENIVFSSSKMVTEIGDENGVVFGEPKDAPEIKSQLIQTETPEYVVLFRRLPSPSYTGEFGWDYMRDDYLTGTCIEGLEDLKKEYKPFEIKTINATTSKPYGTYYSPWLSMFVDHKTIIGKDVELYIEAPIDFISDSVDFGNEEMIFVPSSPFLRVVPDKIPITNAINGVRIKIFCDATLDKDATIEIKSSKGDIVGRMNVLKNKDVDELTINVYVIKAFVSDNPLFSEAVIDGEMAKIGGLIGLENYLNKQSLNQGLIQVKLIDVDTSGKVLKMPLSTNTFNLANKGYNTMTSKPDDEYVNLKGIITKQSIFEVDSGKSVNLFNKQANKLYGLDREKCILLYLCPLNTKDAGGSSYTIPLNNKHCIIFKTNLHHLTSYAHEIAHTLGLDHTFLAKDSSCNLINLTTEKSNIDNEVVNFREKIIVGKTNIDNQWSVFRNARENKGYFDSISVNSEEYTKYKKPFDNAKNELDKTLQEYTKNKNDEKNLIVKNNIRFTRALTENIMDYSSDDVNCDGIRDVTGITIKKSFNKYQWKIIQEETKLYYH